MTGPTVRLELRARTPREEYHDHVTGCAQCVAGVRCAAGAELFLAAGVVLAIAAVVCSWCGATIAGDPTAGVISHGMCRACLEKTEVEMGP